MRIYSVIILLMLLSGWTRAQDKLKFISLPPEEFREEMGMVNNAMLIDVREFFEYKRSRIRSAVNIPSSGNLGAASDTIAKNQNLFLYCTTGFRSKKAAGQLVEKGFTNVFSLDGGVSEWKKKGFPIDRKRVRKSR